MSRLDDLDRGLGVYLRQQAQSTTVPPEVLDAVRTTTAARRQRRAWVAQMHARWSGLSMGQPAAGREALVLVAALVALLGLAVALATAGSRPPRPLGVVVASASPAVPSEPASPAIGTLPAPMLATWVADTGPMPSLGSTSDRSRLVFASSGGSVWLDRDDGGVAMRSTIIQPRTNGELRIVLQKAAGGCPAGAEGFYRWSLSPDDLDLTLATIDDPCLTRREAYARTWTRSLTGQSTGGTGVVDAFEPAFQVTLPDGTWEATSYVDAVEIGRPDPPLVLYAFKDPQGFTEPCAQDGGRRRPVAPGVDAFASYLHSIPGFEVSATEMTVDGHRALHLGVVQGGPAMCTGERVVEWQAKAETGTLNWILGRGDPDSLYVVELPTATILLQVIGATPTSGPTADEQAILTSVRFLEALPASPP
jgi:hypothetical protein